MLLVEFAITYGNDWFVLPIDLDVGSLCRTRLLIVTNTFGERFLIRSSTRRRCAAMRHGACSSCPPNGVRTRSPAHDPRRLPAAAHPGQHAREPCQSRTSCSYATRWRTWPGPSSASSKARSSARAIASRRHVTRATPATPPLPRRHRELSAGVRDTRQLGAAAAGADRRRAAPEARQGAEARWDPATRRRRRAGSSTRPAIGGRPDAL